MKRINAITVGDKVRVSHDRIETFEGWIGEVFRSAGEVVRFDVFDNDGFPMIIEKGKGWRVRILSTVEA